MIKDNKIESELCYVDTASGIRGLAVVIVLLYHAFGNLMLNFGAYTSRTGLYGVAIFFALSSFLLANKFFHKGFSLKEVSGYFLGRVMRIIPIFILAAFVYYKLGMIDLNKFKEVILFKSTYAHLWTIPIEFAFYIILPLLVFTGCYLNKKYGFYSTMIFLLIVAITLRTGVIPQNNVIDFAWLPVFIMGVMICFIYNKYTINFFPLVSDLLIMLSFCFMIVLAPTPMYMLFGYRPQPDDNGILMWGTAASLFFFLSIFSTGYFNALLKSKLLTYLGKWSFSIYLFHWAVIQIAARYKTNDLSIFIFSVFESVGLGALVYYLVECPVEKLRHYYMGALFKKRNI